MLGLSSKCIFKNSLHLIVHFYSRCEYDKSHLNAKLKLFQLWKQNNTHPAKQIVVTCLQIIIQHVHFYGTFAFSNIFLINLVQYCCIGIITITIIKVLLYYHCNACHFLLETLGPVCYYCITPLQCMSFLARNTRSCLLLLYYAIAMHVISC